MADRYVCPDCDGVWCDYWGFSAHAAGRCAYCDERTCSKHVAHGPYCVPA